MILPLPTDRHEKFLSVGKTYGKPVLLFGDFRHQKFPRHGRQLPRHFIDAQIRVSLVFHCFLLHVFIFPTAFRLSKFYKYIIPPIHHTINKNPTAKNILFLGDFVYFMIIMSNFVERLDELMFDNQLTVKMLTKEINIQRATINRYLSGEVLPSLQTAVKLADLFHCSVDYLLGLTNTTPDSFLPCPPFAERLKFLLEHFHCTQYRLYTYGDFPPSAVPNWLHGKYTPSLDNVVKIAKFFDRSVDFILGREK